MIYSPLFGMALTIICFEIGVYLNKKTGLSVVNPLVVALVLCIVILKVFNIPLAAYQKGGDIINMLLPPVTAILAVSIYEQLEVLKRFFIPVVAGVTVGSITAVISAYMLCKLFGVDDAVTMAMVPKSVTTPIAIELSRQLGGNVSITVAAVMVTGILGAVFAPILIKIFKIKNPVARGVAIGTSSHALGTTKAVEIGEVEGAMSGVAIGIAGVVTVVIAMFF